MAQHNPTIAILQVQHILRGAQRRGLDREALLRRAGIAPALLGSPLARVTQAQYAALIQVLTRRLRDELWGLASRPLPPGSFAQGCRAVIHCATLGQALREGFGFYRLLIDDFRPRLTVQGPLAGVRLQRRQPAAPGQAGALGYAERTFSFFAYGLASWLVARRIPVQAVTYRDADLGMSSDAERLFQAPVEYGHPWVGFRFEARWLQLPVVQTPQSLDEFLRAAPASLLVKYRDNARLSERVRALMRRRLGEGALPELAAVARSLSLIPQTLRRRLQAEGQGFQSIADDLRRDAAIAYLADARLPLADVAARLGFAEASTFHRAFKGWTGLAPGAYRRERAG